MSDPARAAVGEVRRGNRDAFGRLVEMYQGRLFGLVMIIVRERAAAEEVTQDAFVRAFTHLDRYDEHQPFYPWLATIAVRLSQNRLRWHGRVAQREGTPLEAVTEPAAEASALASLVKDEARQQLWDAVAALTSGERTAVMLYYRDEMAVGDIARALGVSSGTIKTLLFRARRRLRERLGAALRGEEIQR